ncbi:MAG: hypothetical protein FH749_04710 [Firmicutes bacterium]|nr:hypothetical protein [Bacillota bacterium]
MRWGITVVLALLLAVVLVLASPLAVLTEQNLRQVLAELDYNELHRQIQTRLPGADGQPLAPGELEEGLWLLTFVDLEPHLRDNLPELALSLLFHLRDGRKLEYQLSLESVKEQLLAQIQEYESFIAILQRADPDQVRLLESLPRLLRQPAYRLAAREMERQLSESFPDNVDFWEHFRSRSEPTLEGWLLWAKRWLFALRALLLLTPILILATVLCFRLRAVALLGAAFLGAGMLAGLSLAVFPGWGELAFNELFTTLVASPIRFATGVSAGFGVVLLVAGFALQARRQGNQT